MLKSKFALRGREVSRLTEDAAISRAFDLAHSIYRYDEAFRRVALNIVSEALRAVSVRLTAQVEADRHDPQKPTKVRWNAVQWFQILIYCKSETYEMRQEADGNTSLSQEDMMVRYMKHLILTTCRRNSFHVSLGLSRLLYGYSAAEAMSIYDLIFQDPDSSTRKVDAYYRARKNVLIEELRRRFHHFVRVEEGSRGEKRFQLQEDSSKFGELVAQCLTRFTPWKTRCELPNLLDALTSHNSVQSSQANQIHTLIHPACFSRITEALKLDPPPSRLALPRFFSADTPPPDRSPAPELTEEETTEILEGFNREGGRRKEFTPRTLCVLVGGVERARLDLSGLSEIRFDLRADDTLIELIGRAEESEILLAAHVITYDDEESQPGQSKEYSTVLEGGQKISLIIETGHTDEGFAASARINYQETKASRAFILWSRRFRNRVFGVGTLKSWRGVPILGTATAILLMTLAAAFVILYLASRGGPGERIVKLQPSPSSVKAGEATTQETPTPMPQATAIPERTPSSVRRSEPPARGHRPSTESTTREQIERVVRALSDVRVVYVESFGDDPFGQSVRRQLIEKLEAGHDFAITDSPDDADTAIAGSARFAERKPEGTGRDVEVGDAALKVVNVSGEVIWRAKRYRGTASFVADQFARELREAIEAGRRRRKKD